MNDYNGVMRGPYLSRGDKDHVTPENCLWAYPSRNSKSYLTLYWNVFVFFLFFFFSHLSIIDRIFLAMTKFFSGHNDRKRFAIISV